MSPRTGRPKSINPKNVDTRIRMDIDTARKLEYCANKLATTKSDVIRRGIDLVVERLQAKNK